MDEFYFFLLICGIVVMSIVLPVTRILISKNRLKKAALALGDDFYVTGIPNMVWKKYARSFTEYQRLLHALAQSGDLSNFNVHRFVSSFTGENVHEFENNSYTEVLSRQHSKITSGSDFSNPYSIDSLSMLGNPSGTNLSDTTSDITSRYSHDSGTGHTPGSGY